MRLGTLVIALALTAPVATAGKATLEISTTADRASDRVMGTRAAVFRACFQKEMNRNPSLREHASRLELHVSVDKGNPHVPVFDEKASVNDDNVKSCVALTIKRLTFPKTATELDYTLTFTP
ncbi:MAG TPA: hypothetical protein VGM90_20790 [Kofleriaceae bacterium]|jgi:hypothetical protein